MAVKSKSSSQDWFYHAPSELKALVDAPLPAVSQIPGLSQIDLSIEPRDDRKYTRKWIRDTDSDYIRLAKAGGRKDMFRYRENKRSSEGPVPYPRSDWFDHDFPEDNQISSDRNNNKIRNIPEWFTHEEHVNSDNSTTEKLKRPILGFDELSIWRRDEEELKLPIIPSKLKNRKSKSVGFKEEGVKFPRILPRGGRKKSIDNGEMNDLLKYSYQKQFLQETTERNIENERKKQGEFKDKREKMMEDKEKYGRQKKCVPTPKEKPLFKLSKFGNVPSRIDSHRY